jgi:hypothetical protein
LIATVSPAAASETIGRVAPAPVVSCTGSTTDLLEPAVTTGIGYVVPTLPNVNALMISSWSHSAAPAPATGALTFKVFRKVADPATYMVVGSDGPRDLTAGALNTFPTDVPVQPGDVIGINSAKPASTACTFFDATENPLIRAGNLAVDESASFMTGSEKDANVSAVVSPSDAFTLGLAKLKKRKGTATLDVTVPNPGELAMDGTGIRAPRASVDFPSTIRFQIKAKGPKQSKLKRKGKVKVMPTITYTPTGGEPSSQSVTLRLRLRGT